MAKIPLRSYIQEIEGLIDRGQTDEAIAHCKHILKYYPKHIDTYRMLGKAYLESQRYSEAADVLHRVLSVFPDDFVSQIGMSIIREDEGNLDASIWHMERTFEVQPANTAVQDELRRLYGRRDGVEPPKVRLTRGALARLYARGELYPQAIAEIRAALAEDPDRVDLEVILAQTYYASGQKVEATETCSRLVNKLPFCYEANRLLAEILPGTSRAEDAKTYQQRIFALDPYAAYISPSAPTSTQVPDNAVTLDHFDWQPPQENAQQQPEWAKTVGIDLGETEEALPDWLTPMPSPPSAQSENDFSNEISPADLIETPVSADTQGALSNTPSEEEVIPDWMKTAGWAPSSGEETPPPSVPEGKFEEQIAPADIPDWLQSFAPSDNTAQEPQSPEEQEKLEMLDKILPPQSAEAAQSEIAASPESSYPEEVVPDAGPGKTQPVSTHFEPTQPHDGLQEQAAPAEALPDWLQGLGIGESGLEAEKAKSDQIPDWMQSLNEPAKESEPQPAEPLPDWLSDFAAEQNTSTGEVENPSEELPEWIKPANAEKPVEETQLSQFDTAPQEELDSKPTELTQETVTPVSINTTDDVDAAMAWLESLAAKQGADQETLTSRPEDRLETPPEWVQREMESNAPAASEIPTTEHQPEQAVEEPAAVFQPVEQIEPVITDTDQSAAEPITMEETTAAEEMVSEPVAETAQFPEEATSEENPVISAGLQPEIAPEAIAVSEAESNEDTYQASIEAEPIQAVSEEEQLVVAMEQPEQTAEVEATSTEPIMEEQAPVAEVSQIEEPAIANLSEDDGFAWLEALAAKQGADEGTLTLAPQERSETPPSWINQAQTTRLEPLPETTSEPISQQPESQEFGVPEWLQSDGFIEQEGAVEPAMQENQAVDKSIPDWLKELEVEEPTAEAVKTPSSEEVPIEPLPDWLQGLNIEDETRRTNKNLEPVEEKSDTLPDWMQSVENKPIEEPQTPIEEPTFVEPEPLPDWLRGLDEAATPTLETASEIGKTEDVPTWVNELDNPSSDETRPGATKPLVFPLDIREPIEPEGSFEVTSEEETSIPEIVQTETFEAVAPAADLSAISEESIPDGDRDMMLSQAQKAMDKGRLSEALDAYNQLISSGNLLEEAIHDLRDALYRYPVDIGLWQALGDAYVRDNRLQDALDAYTKAEELIR